MCFTVNVNLVKEELENRFNTSFIDHENYHPSYYYHAHALPEIPVAGHFDKSFSIRLLKWGLIPGWARGAEEAEKIRYSTFNARSESLATKPSFSESFHSRRCIVPVRGFYEWQHKGGSKIPWYVYHPDNKIMMLAGLFDRWQDPVTEKTLHTFTVITSKANSLLAEIHNTKERMPVIISDEGKDSWLNPDSTIPELSDLLKPFPDEKLEAHTISPLINKKTLNKNTPELIKPYDYPDQQSLF